LIAPWTTVITSVVFGFANISNIFPVWRFGVVYKKMGEYV